MNCYKWISAEAGVKKTELVCSVNLQRLRVFCEIRFMAQQCEQMHEEAVPNPKRSPSPRTVADGFQALWSGGYRLTDSY